MANYRYPGTQSFQAADADIFYGREADTDRLLRLIRLEQVVILYGKSGLGKSSLLNAGVLPQLKTETTVEEVRFGGYWEGNSKTPLSALEAQLWQGPLHPIIAQYAEGRDALWCRAKSRELAGQADASLLLVFDQFEELFSYPPAAVHDFKAALAALLQEGSPLWLQQILTQTGRTDPAAISRSLRQQLLAPLRVKVLLTVRSDRLSFLHQFTSHLPNLLVNMYELKPLNPSQARAAVVQPAQQAGDHFATPPFSFTPLAVQIILDSLANEQGEIESFQLQLLCQHLEQKVQANPINLVIEPNDFGGSAGIQEILHGYYERQLLALPEEEQAHARRFIEEGLVVDGRRAAVTAGSEQVRFSVSPALVQRLLDSRLIRVANIHLGRIYELSHDTLVKPVMQSLEERQAAEEKERIAEELRQAEAQNKEERRRRRRARILAIIGFSLFALAALAGVFAWQKYQEAARNERRADAAALAAQSWSIYPQDHTLAFRVAEAALLIDSTSDDARQTLFRIANNPQTSFYRQVLTAHQYEIEDAAFNSDGSRMATAGQDQKIILWNKQGEIIRQYLGKLSGEEHPGHQAQITALGFSTDGNKLFSGAEDEKVMVWSVTTGEKIQEWVAHPGGITTLAVAPGGRNWLATGGVDGLVQLWTLTGEKLATLRGHSAAITQVSVAADGLYILTTSLDGSARLWHSDGRFIRTLVAGEVPINAGCFVPNSPYILLGLRNTSAILLDDQGQEQAVLSGHRGQITSVDAFSQAGNYLLTASDDGTANVWTLDGEIVLTLVGHKKRLNFARISPDQSTIVTGGFDFTVKLWDVGLNLDLQRHRHQNFIYCVDISADDQKIVTASVDGSAKIWNPQGQWQADLIGHSNTVQTAFFIPQVAEVVTAGRDGTVRIWTTEGQELLRLTHPVSFNVARATAGRERIIAGAIDGQVKIWNKAGIPLKEWSTNPAKKPVQWLALSPDGNQIATAQANTVKIWDWEGQLRDSFTNELTEVIYKVAFARDGQSVYTTGKEFPIRRWALSGDPLQNLYGHTQENYWVTVHPNLPLLASASWDQTVTIWDTSGTAQVVIPHPNGVYSVAFSSDAAWLVTGSHDNIGRVWSRDGQLLATLGERADLKPLLTGGLVAPLADIPFSITENQLPLKYLDILAAGRPGQYQREGTAALASAQQNKFTLTEKLSYFDQAANWFIQAKTFTNAQDQPALDQQIAEVYQLKSEQLIINHQFPAALAALEQGLGFAERDYLLVLKTLALAFNGQTAAALVMCEQYQGRLTPQIEWYTDFNEAVVNDLAYFEDQFGISAAGADQLMKKLEN